MGDQEFDPMTGNGIGRLEDFLPLLREGTKIARAGWNGKGMWIEVQYPDPHSKMTLPYLFMKTADDNLVPWLASQTDLLASDWMKVGS